MTGTMPRPPTRWCCSERPALETLLRLGGQAGVTMTVQAKQPGPRIHTRPVDLCVDFNEALGHRQEAYERLLADAIDGDAHRFAREDMDEQAWRVVGPALDVPEPAHRTRKAPGGRHRPTGYPAAATGTTPPADAGGGKAGVAYGWAMEDTTGFAKLLADPRTVRVLCGEPHLTRGPAHWMANIPECHIHTTQVCRLTRHCRLGRRSEGDHPVKPDAATTIAQLRRQGVQAAMLTGDNPAPPAPRPTTTPRP
jgi:hypothetical protein